MKITAVTATAETRRRAEPLVDALQVLDTHGTCRVRVDTDKGISGSAEISFGLCRRPVHANDQSVKRREVRNGVVDALGLASDVRVFRADDDTAVVRALAVQAHEITAIERQHRTTIRSGETKHGIVRDTLIVLASFTDGQDIMAELPQSLDDTHGEVFVRVQAGQGSGQLLLAERLVDLRAVRVDIQPGIDEVRLPQCGEVRENLMIVPAEPPIGLQRPDRDAGADNTGIATLDAGRLLNPRPGVGKVERQPLKDNRPLVAAELLQLLLHILHRHPHLHLVELRDQRSSRSSSISCASAVPGPIRAARSRVRSLSAAAART
jgi:hypothetical protein